MLMQIDGTFVFVIISFIIFLFLIDRLVFRPFTKKMEEREQTLAENMEQEQSAKQEAKNLVLDRDRKIKSSRAQAGEYIKKTSTEAKNSGEKQIKRTKRELQEELDKHKDELMQSSVNSKNELKSEVTGYVKSIVSKILNEDVEIEIEEAKIKEYLKI